MHAAAPDAAGRRRGDVVGVGVARRAEDLAEDRRARGPTACSHSSRISTAAPSPMTKPSRSTSNGRLTPVVESAVMLAKPASAVIVAADSAPPVATASQRPQAIRRAALPMACVPAAQAVAIVSFGPCSPKRIEIAAPAALAIIIGTRNGDTRRSPFVDAHADLLLERVQAADAGGEDRAEAGRVDADRVDAAGLGERLGRRGDGELLDAVGAPRLLRRRVPRRRVPVGDLGRPART